MPAKKPQGPQPKFVLDRSRDGQWYFTLRAANGKTILQSETYKTRKGALNGIEAVKTAAPAARTVAD